MELPNQNERQTKEVMDQDNEQDNEPNVDTEECNLEKALSKRQLKKLKKTEKWHATKYQKRADERQRKKDKRKIAKEQGIDLGPSRKSLKKNTMAGSSCKVKVVVDCSFDDLMTDKDIGNLVKQLNHCYAANRRNENPLQFYTTCVEKKLKARLDAQDDTKYWDIHMRSDSYERIFDKKDIVYLSSDSDNILTTLEDDKVYIIGGLVDHNHHKGLCHRMAVEKKLYHAKLPISDYVHFSTRKVLTVNQVFEILLGYTETQDWEKAFLKALPKRKGAVTKCPTGSSKEDANYSTWQADDSDHFTSQENDKDCHVKQENVTDSDSINTSCSKLIEESDNCLNGVSKSVLKQTDIAECSESKHLEKSENLNKISNVNESDGKS